MLIEVRCCCRPEKLLGWLPAPSAVRIGALLHFNIPYRAIGRVLLGEEILIQEATHIVLPVAIFYDGTTDGMALKSEETPIETLRQIPGFIEHLTSR